jgi:hypothetical protein
MTWGRGEWGDTPWGAGSDTDGFLRVLGAQVVAENVVRVTFNAAPRYSGLLGLNDASDVARWQIVAVGGEGLDGDPARAVNPVEVVVAAVAQAQGRQLDVTVDRPFTHYPAVYRVTVNGLVSAEGGVFLGAGQVTAIFFGVRAGERVQSVDSAVAGVDLLLPSSEQDYLGAHVASELGKLNVDATGDYASGSPLAGYRTRVYRRALTVLFGFAHLPGYGADAGRAVKSPTTRPDAELAAVRLEDQIRLEPETLAVRVTVTVFDTGEFRYRIRARCKLGEVDVSVP